MVVEEFNSEQLSTVKMSYDHQWQRHSIFLEKFINYICDKSVS